MLNVESEITYMTSQIVIGTIDAFFSSKHEIIYKTYGSRLASTPAQFGTKNSTCTIVSNQWYRRTLTFLPVKLISDQVSFFVICCMLTMSGRVPWMTGGSPPAAAAAGAGAAAGGFAASFFPVGGFALAAGASVPWTPLATTPGLHTTIQPGCRSQTAQQQHAQ
jgi:hypothetical protein